MAIATVKQGYFIVGSHLIINEDEGLVTSYSDTLDVQTFDTKEEAEKAHFEQFPDHYPKEDEENPERKDRDRAHKRPR